jgi:GalNAc-alpha-(1->4)-GalNAc-alpha-(1->3)-diNAcBac-PP-undecaprenol alpha-1,4-N-acetyl-D-galactosaminyltransferase
MDNSKKKLMFVTGSLSDGGAERVISILASGCADLGADVTIVIMREKKRIYELSQNVKVLQVKCDSKKFKVFSRIYELHNAIKNSNADVVIPFLPIITLYIIISNIGIGRKIITSERADPYKSIFSKGYTMKDRAGNLLMRRLGMYNFADWMVFQTPDAQAYYSKRLKRKSSIIPNPLDTSALPKRYEGEREKRIVAAGRLSEEKNFSLLIKGFAEFHKEFPEYTMTIYGEGVQRRQLENEIVNLNMQQYISLPGFISNIPENIYKAAMYISTSNHEGISNSMLEALGVGLPTIVTDCPVGGARMFVKTDENGIIIPINDQQKLVSAMKKIAFNHEYAMQISVEATKICGKISADNICKQWLELV